MFSRAVSLVGLLALACGGRPEGDDFEEPPPPPKTELCFEEHPIEPPIGPPWALDIDANGRADMFALGGGRLEYILNPDTEALKFERIDLSNEPTGYVHGDLNADGYPDILLALDTIGYATVWGGPAGPTGLDEPLGDPTDGPMALGDFDGDGVLDLADSMELVRVRLGAGDGNFGAPTERHSMPGGMGAGDFDEDGHDDIAIARNTHFTILWGDDEDPLGSRDDFKRLQHSVHGFRATDINHDGHLDLLTNGTYDSPVVFIGDGQGQFGAGAASHASDIPGSIPVDIDGDGLVDVLSGADTTNSMSAIYGRILQAGDFGFGELHEIDPPFALHPLLALDDDFAPGFGAADWTGDGRADIAGYFWTCDGERCDDARFLASCE